MAGRAVWGAVALAVLAAACGDADRVPPASTATPRAPATLPAGALALASEVRVVSAPEVAADSLDPATLEALLADAGFVIGRQREFRGGSGRFRRVLARVLLFDDAQGAARLVAWVRDHPTDLLGTVDRRDAAVPPGAVLFRSTPSGCCVKETMRVLVVWQRGATVRWLYLSGPGVGDRVVEHLAGQLDRVP